jgi:hypothetical protein
MSGDSDDPRHSLAGATAVSVPTAHVWINDVIECIQREDLRHSVDFQRRVEAGINVAIRHALASLSSF